MLTLNTAPAMAFVQATPTRSSPPWSHKSECLAPTRSVTVNPVRVGRS